MWKRYWNGLTKSEKRKVTTGLVIAIIIVVSVWNSLGSSDKRIDDFEGMYRSELQRVISHAVWMHNLKLCKPNRIFTENKNYYWAFISQPRPRNYTGNSHIWGVTIHDPVKGIGRGAGDYSTQFPREWGYWGVEVVFNVPPSGDTQISVYNDYNYSDIPEKERDRLCRLEKPWPPNIKHPIEYQHVSVFSGPDGGNLKGWIDRYPQLGD